MNFTQVIEQGDMVVELKYCERCGGLWLRQIENEESYCDNCRAAITAWPRIRRKGEQPKTFKHRMQGEGPGSGFVDNNQAMEIPTLHGVAEIVEERECEYVTVAPPEVRS